MQTFSELSLTTVLSKNLAKNQWVTPTPVQAEAIPPALEGRDIVATAQTGTGKTLAFLLPLLQSLTSRPVRPGVQALILSPTRELALQINEVFIKLAANTNIRSAAVVGGMSETAQLQAIARGAQVVVATPGRLADYINRRLIKLKETSFLVLDEADHMLDMGFLPTVRMIMSALPAERQTLFFSATIETSVAHLIQTYLKNPVRIAIGAITRPAERVRLHLYEVDHDRKFDLLMKMLDAETGTFLVFAGTKHGADRLAMRLARDGVNAAAVHGGRSQGQRNRALQGFKDGAHRVLVATDLAARGIHVEGIAHVVNFDLPQVPEDFIHRVGRTGRAGLGGSASTFCTRGERHEINRIERALNIQLQRQPVQLPPQEMVEKLMPREASPAGPAAKRAPQPAARHRRGPSRFDRRRPHSRASV